MPRRPATVTQADVARTLRAVMASGLKVARIVTRKDGVAIETVDAPSIDEENNPTPVASGKVVVL